MVDLPQKDITFVKSAKSVAKTKKNFNVLYQRDPVKIFFEEDDVRLLADVEDSIISRLQNTFNFIPNVYASASAIKTLRKYQVITIERPSKKE